MVQYVRSSRSSWTKSVRSLFGRTIMGSAIWESCSGTRWGKSSTLGMLFRSQRERIILVCFCGRYQNVRKETKSGPNVEDIYERSWFGRTNIILWPCLFGLHSTRMQYKQTYSGQFQGYVWIQDVRWRYTKLSYSEKSEAHISSWSYDMEGHAKKRVERYCDLTNSTIHHLHRAATLNLEFSSISLCFWLPTAYHRLRLRETWTLDGSHVGCLSEQRCGLRPHHFGAWATQGASVPLIISEDQHPKPKDFSLRSVLDNTEKQWKKKKT